MSQEGSRDGGCWDFRDTVMLREREKIRTIIYRKCPLDLLIDVIGEGKKNPE